MFVLRVGPSHLRNGCNHRQKPNTMLHHASTDATDAAPPTIGSDAAAPRSDNRLSQRVVVVGLLAAVLTIMTAFALLQVFVAEQIPELTEERLAAAQERWQRNGPASYDMDLDLRGARPGTVHIEVRNGAATAMTRDGRSPPERTWDVWSVTGQFETLERELELAEDPVHEMEAKTGTQLRLRCAFDSKYGFPLRYHRTTSGGGPEVYWRVTRFEPR